MRCFISMALGMLLADRLLAGFLDPTNAPRPTMNTLEDVYLEQVAAHQVVSAVAVSQAISTATTALPAGYYQATVLSAVDTNLVAGNIRAGVTVFGVAGKTEVVDTTSGNAAAGDLRQGAKVWARGAEISGSAPAGSSATGAAGQVTVPIANGLHSGATTVTVTDSNLVAGNVRSGVVIFGVAGKQAVVDTTSGNATPGDLLAGRRAWVGGVAVTGSLATATLTDTSVTVAAGYYHATTLSAVDPDLAAGNIKTNVTIFGIPGTVPASGTSGYPLALPQTGQTTSYRAGDDGAHQTGVAPPVQRFVDNGDGTVNDKLTGMMWSKNANLCLFGVTNWYAAMDTCDFCVLGNYGDWRLPNIRELLSLVDAGHATPCLPAGHPFTNVLSPSNYWSSTALASDGQSFWSMSMADGRVSYTGRSICCNAVWPVRLPCATIDGPYVVRSPPSTNNGIVTWWLATGTNYANIDVNGLDVILPPTYSTNKQYKVLYIGQVFGTDEGGITEARDRNIASSYDIICVQNVIRGGVNDNWGWGVDAESNRPDIQQHESYWLKAVVPFIDATYSTLKTNDGRMTIGFSKAGFCAINLVLRHPDLFSRAGSWDGAGVGSGNRTEFQMSPGYCNAYYTMENLLKANKAMYSNQLPRFAITGYNTMSSGVVATHNEMVADGIPHYYDNSTFRSQHAWNSGWFEPLVSVMMRANMTNQ